MGVKARRVAVIGTGPAGAIATEALVKEQAFQTIRVFERKNVAGGTWVYSPQLSPKIPSLRALLNHQADPPVTIPNSFPCETHLAESLNSHQMRYSDTAIHDKLHSNLPPQTMCFTQEPIPSIVSQRTMALYGGDAPFRHREVIREWVEDIFTHGGYHHLIEFNTTVERAEKRGDEWVLTLRRARPTDTTNYWWQEVFDAVIVATGHYSLPFLPDIPGLIEYDESFPGTIRHSKHFRSTEEFKGKRVIVVGGSVSAFDALHEIRTVAQHPVYASLKEPLQSFGWAPFTHPHITVKPPIARFHADTGRIDFSDGSSVDHADIVLFATGYDFSLPFLPGSISQLRNRRICGLYQHVFNTGDPTLIFIGMVAGGLSFRVFEWQAVAAARVLAGRAILPPEADRWGWEQDRIVRCGDGPNFFTISDDFEGYFEGLRKLVGEPAPGTKGRTLPKFERWWIEAFQQVATLRSQWWFKEKRKAEADVNHPFGRDCRLYGDALPRPSL